MPHHACGIADEERRMANIAILGYGTVGSGIYEVLRTNADVVAQRAGEEACVKYVLDLREFPGDPVEEVLIHDVSQILEDPAVDVVVETMGGLKPAYEFTKQALQAGKSVCTSNKELVAEHGVELLQIAKEHKVSYLFEASCGGGIPIIHGLQYALTADRIESIGGIFNGTTNYILTKMAREGSDFQQALEEAQANGYAEKNPEADIEGHDTCRKLAILSSLAYGSHVDYRDIHTEGISQITKEDIRYAENMRMSIKLLARSEREGDAVRSMVVPAMIPAGDPLYAVEDVFNAVVVRGNMLGDVMFYGSGAGSLPTASAVVSDIVDCIKYKGTTIDPGVEGNLSVRPFEEVENRFFVRIEGELAERLPEITRAFGRVEPVRVPEKPEEFGVITTPIKEKEFTARLADLADVLGTPIRVL